MAITDLTGTKWQISQNISIFTDTKIYSLQGTVESEEKETGEPIAFPIMAMMIVNNSTSKAVAFGQEKEGSGGAQGVGNPSIACGQGYNIWRYNANIIVTAPIVTITGGDGATDPDVIAWFEANATQIIDPKTEDKYIDETGLAVIRDWVKSKLSNNSDVYQYSVDSTDPNLQPVTGQTDAYVMEIPDADWDSIWSAKNAGKIVVVRVKKLYDQTNGDDGLVVPMVFGDPTTNPYGSGFGYYMEEPGGASENRLVVVTMQKTSVAKVYLQYFTVAGSGDGNANFNLDTTYDFATIQSQGQGLSFQFDDADSVTMTASDPGTYQNVKKLATKDYVDSNFGSAFIVDTANPCSYNELQSAINAPKVILIKHEGIVYPFVEKWESDEGTKRYVNIAALQRQAVDKGAMYFFFEATIGDFDSPITYSSNFVQPTGKPYTDSVVGNLTNLTTTTQTDAVSAINELKSSVDALGEPFRVKQWGANNLNVTIVPCTSDTANTSLAKMTFTITGQEATDYQIVGMISYEVFDATSGGNRINCWPVCQFTGNGQTELSVRWMCGGTTNQVAKRINAWVLLKHR